MEIISFFIDFIIHLDTHLTDLVNQYGLLTYAVLFLIVFAETGFVITPFLPGDSLLFAAGAIAALGSLNIGLIIILLIIAAVLGDTVNYWIGHFFGKKIIDNPKFPFINQEHIDKTEQFYKNTEENDYSCPICPDHPYLCAVCCWCRNHGIFQVYQIQHYRWSFMDFSIFACRILFW